MRHTPTTLTKDFGSAPTVSSEKSIFTDCPAWAYASSAARPRLAMAILAVCLLVFMLDLRFSSGVRRVAAGGDYATMREQSAGAGRRRTRRARASRWRAADSLDSPGPRSGAGPGGPRARR